MVIKEILNRRSVRSYKSDPVPDDALMDIIKAAQFAPTAINNRAVEFIVIKDEKTKKRLFEITEPRQAYLKEAPILIVPVSDAQKSVLPLLDISIASENIFIQAISLGLGTVWKNVRPEQAEEIKELLNIPKHFTLTNIIPLGYPKETHPPHSDAEFAKEKTHNEKW